MKRVLAATAMVGLMGCASLPWSRKPTPRVDLGPARQAVEDAQKAGAAEKAPDSLNQAIAHLREAEGLLVQEGSGARERAEKADWLARLAVTQARCALSIARMPTREETRATGAERDRLEALVKRGNEERRRLEERVAMLQRDLELTETEVIRAKARLQGMETKAEASSAVAEARILMKRLESRGKPASLARVQELVAKAEQQLVQDNYGAAVFFARRAQDVANRAGESQ